MSSTTPTNQPNPTNIQKTKHRFHPNHKTSTSPLSQAPFTPSHRATQTSPIRIVPPNTSSSILLPPPPSGGATTTTSSARHLTKTTSRLSGPWTILVPPALSSNLLNCGGNELRKLPPKCRARSCWCVYRNCASEAESGEPGGRPPSSSSEGTGIESSGCWSFASGVEVEVCEPGGGVGCEEGPEEEERRR